MQTKDNEDKFVELILQALGEESLSYGAYSRFARVFKDHSGIKISRSTVRNWLKKGVPTSKVKHCVSLSEKKAKYKKLRITSQDLRPDIFGK